MRGAAAASIAGGSTDDALDTSYVAVVDAEGNAFSATPSDPNTDSPVVAGVGCVVSPRGSQGWLDPAHKSVVAPGKRPRLTPAPAMAFRDGRVFMPFGTPGGDVQQQAMLQVFLNITVFGMPPQRAVEAPRVASRSFPDSFWPHAYAPDKVEAERPHSRGDARGARRARPRRRRVAGLGVARGRGRRGDGRRGGHALGRRRSAPRRPRDRRVERGAADGWRAAGLLSKVAPTSRLSRPRAGAGASGRRANRLFADHQRRPAAMIAMIAAETNAGV